MRSSVRLALLLSSAALLAAAPGHAQWIPGGVPVSGGKSGDINLVVTDGAGGAYVGWRRSVGQSDVYLQRVTAGGFIEPPWPDTSLAIATTPFDDLLTDIASDGGGGAFVVWEMFSPDSPTGRDVFVQRVMPSATPAPGWPSGGVRIDAPRSQGFAKLAAGEQGRSFIVWEDRRDIVTTGTTDIYAIGLLSDGSIAPGWPAAGLPVSVGLWSSSRPQAVPDGQGGVFFAWDDNRDLTQVTYGLRLLADGSLAPGWAPNGNRLAPEVFRNIESDGTGGCYVMSAVVDPNFSFDLVYYLRRYSADGTLSPGWPSGGLVLCDAAGFRSGGHVASDGQGGAYAAWYDSRGAEIFLIRVLPNGTLAPGWTEDGKQVSDPLNGAFESDPVIVSDGAGGAFVAWELSNLTGVVHHLTASGQPAPGWPAYGLPFQPGLDAQIATDQEGGAIVAWSYQDVRAQRYVATGIVAANLTLVSAVADPERVRLEWFAADGAGLVATVERHEGSDEWRAIGAITADGTGHFRFEDRAVTPGARYAYRLGYRDQGSEHYTSETLVEVPTAYELALDGFRPNPAVGSPVVSFTLPRPGPGRLELFDLAGRRVAVRDLGGLSAGRHSLRLATESALHPAAYVLRLTHGGRAVSRRGVVVR